MQRFRNILCVVEHGESGRPALERAATLARNNQASLTVVDVIPRIPAGISMPDGGPISRDLQEAMVREHEASLVSLLGPYRDNLDIGHGVLMGTPFLEIVRAVLRSGYDLVIKCPESPSWLDRFFSGDDMHLLRKCPCPVWLVKPQAPETYGSILAAVDVYDGYPEKELEARRRLNVQVLEMAVSVAISESAELHVVHAWESLSDMARGLVFSSDLSNEKIALNMEQERRHQRQLLDQFMQSMRVSASEVRDALDYLDPAIHLLKGGARREIPALTKRLAVDCIVMGTVARTGIRGFIMGNTAETILEQIECSVLAIKPDGFRTPIALDK